MTNWTGQTTLEKRYGPQDPQRNLTGTDMEANSFSPNGKSRAKTRSSWDLPIHFIQTEVICVLAPILLEQIERNTQIGHLPYHFFGKTKYVMRIFVAF